MIRFHLVTLFPEACEPYLNASILGRARKSKKIKISYQNPRDFVDNTWGKVDERPYGGGPGMVMQALPVVRAVQKAVGRKQKAGNKTAILWFSPGARAFTNKEADTLAKFSDVVLVCGRYEGIDERAAHMLKTLGTLKKYSVGEAVLTGGELPAMVVVDAVTRRLPGVLGKDESVEERRVAGREVYTRPEVIVFGKKKYAVPNVLLSGHHAHIDTWKKS
ncbi:tRNA (guanosine(37)-N1)-methyltransferase TrmD, partial [Candidatus Parcubacteria bacterium]|nr:tRNA (guanosine(37)-N1)-methyltransferase TrmD [Candidatus Parcubacteria bacterium]